ncbi:MAG TPA: glycoside hydrolase family 18 protein, partial [Candidatus Hydrogenedentes bacterium]|nr:glycoside hydrolase family 18 protein [Candidatus Hydrogenedentota bacterium]
MRRTALAVLLCAALAGAGCAGLRRDRAEAFRVVGYAPDYSLERTDPAAFGRLTDAILFSVEPTPDGTFPVEALAAAPVARFQEIKRAHGVRVHLCFGGWGRSAGFAPMATDPAKRAAF